MKHTQTFKTFISDKDNSVNEGHNYSSKDIEKAVEAAEFDFWASIAKSFSEIKTGDFSPNDDYNFNKATTSAVTTWLKSNS
jgi:hypothetical protein